MKVFEIEIEFTATKTISVVAPNEEEAIVMAKCKDELPEDGFETSFFITDECEIEDADDIPDDAIKPTCNICHYAVDGFCECPYHLYRIPIEKFTMICDYFN